MRFQASAIVAAAISSPLLASAQTLLIEHNGVDMSLELSTPTDYHRDVPFDSDTEENTLEVSDDSRTVHIAGNQWKALQLTNPIEITEDTMLEVTLGLEQRVDFHSLCLDNDAKLGGGDVRYPDLIDNVRCVVLSGNNMGNIYDQFRNEGSMPGTYIVPIGNLFTTGIANYLAFVQSYSGTNKAMGGSSFGNIKIYDANRPDLQITGPSGPVMLTHTQSSYGFGKDTRTNILEVSPDGNVASLSGNTWRALPLPEPIDVTYYTILEFELRTDEAGQQSCIGLGENDVAATRLVCDSLGNPHNAFRLHWGSYTDYGEEDEEAYWVKYTVHLGRLYAENQQAGTDYMETMTHLLLMLKNEQNTKQGHIQFRNIAVVEPTPLLLVDQGEDALSKEWLRYHKHHMNSNPEGDFHFVQTSQEGRVATLKGNTHVAYPVETQADEDTILRLNVEVMEMSENLYLCLDDDFEFGNGRSGDGCFRFSGTHNPEHHVFYRGFPQLSAGESSTYYIRLRDYVQGPVNSLAFVQIKRHGDTKAAKAAFKDIELMDASNSCLQGSEFSFSLEECTVSNFLGKIEELLDGNGCPQTDPWIEMMSMYDDLSHISDVEEKIQLICSLAFDAKYLSFEEVTGQENQFTVELLDGGTTWNYQRQATAIGSNLEEQITDVDSDFAASRPISWPDMHSMKKCSLGAAMCCFVSNRKGDVEGLDDDPTDNSEACYMDFTDSRQSSHVRDGYSIYGDNSEGPLNCHGFAWGNDDGYTDSALKGSALFHVAMMNGMNMNGNTEEIPGAPLCGCVEQMPVVSRADCTRVSATTSVTVEHHSGSTNFKTTLAISDITYSDCVDLKSHYESLANDGLVTAKQKHEFDKRIVGEGQCPAAIHAFLSTKGFEYPLPAAPAPTPFPTISIPDYEFNYMVNVAEKFGAATQSTVCHSGIASRAIDGSTSSGWWDGSIMHTCHEDSPWWKVDFSSSPGPVDEVIVFNRMDWGQNWINGVKVEVLDENGNVVASMPIQYEANKQPYSFDFGGVIGSAVRLIKEDVVTSLFVAEVQVFGMRGSSTSAPTGAPTIYWPKGVVMETWFGIAGNSVQDLTMNERFPSSPDMIQGINTLDTGWGRGDNFGSRLCTYIVPPETGDYIFHIASDDYGELYLSDSEDPAGMELVANVPGHTGYKDWFRYAEQQQSQMIHLVEGEKYYMEAFYKEGGGGDHLEVGWTHGFLTLPEIIPSMNTWLPEACAGTNITDFNGAVADYWFDIGGNYLSYLRSSEKYPDSPDMTMYLSLLQIPANRYDNYGCRLRALVVAPVTGDYTFYIASDDEGELYLSDSADPSGLALIANVPGWTSVREWFRFESQASNLIHLDAGESYYLEAFMKEGGGGDNLAVGWKHSGNAEVTVIQGADLLMP